MGEDPIIEKKLEFCFPEKQLQKVLDTFAKKEEPGLKIDKLLQALQVISIVAAAAWTLFNFFSFERQERRLSERIQEINRDQAGFTLQQNKILADTQQTLARINLEQQSFTLTQQKLLASSAAAKAALDVRSLELETKLKGIEVRNAGQTPLQFEPSMTMHLVSPAQAGGLEEWEVELRVSLNNISKNELALLTSSGKGGDVSTDTY